MARKSPNSRNLGRVVSWSQKENLVGFRTAVDLPQPFGHPEKVSRIYISHLIQPPYLPAVDRLKRPLRIGDSIPP
jgi:hypothetical protein